MPGPVSHQRLFRPPWTPITNSQPKQLKCNTTALWCSYTPVSCFPPETPQELLQPLTLNSCLSGIYFCACRAALACSLVSAESSVRCHRSRHLYLVTLLAALQASRLLPHAAQYWTIFKSWLQYTKYANINPVILLENNTNSPRAPSCEWL